MLGQSSDYLKSFEDNFGVWRVFQLVGEVLAGPVFIVLSLPPHFRIRHVVDYSLVGDPDLRLVLPVAERQLAQRDGS
jgi:hypothetical protein